MMGDDDAVRVFAGGKLLDSSRVAEMMRMVELSLPDYAHDQYRYYPSKDAKAWERLLTSRLRGLMRETEWSFFFGASSNRPHLIGCRISSWDEEHFGFRMATMQVFVGQDASEFRILVGKCLDFLRDQGVVFVSARINGDSVGIAAEFQTHGFRYYENVIWPVRECADIGRCARVRLMTDSDLDSVVRIARSSSFRRSHFHCDDRFPKDKVDAMQAKWIRTSWERSDPIAVIECGGEVAGYFLFAIDGLLSETLGYRYARMRHLALLPAFRGRGLGKALFGGTIALMKEMGVDYIDSGYASKNHMSARLHTLYAFQSVYEEITLHLWLREVNPHSS